MSGSALHRLAGALGCLSLWCCLVIHSHGTATAAQNRNDTEATKPGEPSIEEDSLPIYYVKDEDGELVPMLGWTLDQIKKAQDILLGLRPREPPRYTIQRLTASGTAKGQHAELNVQVTVLVREDDWVRVPLRMDRALLREPAGYRGPGEHVVKYAGPDEGYVCWLKGPQGKQHELTLKMLVPLEVVGNRTRLSLLAARATASELKLNVPLADAVGEVSEGAVLLPPSAGHNGSTDFSVLGLDGDFQLSWHTADDRIAEVPIVLEAVGAILARVDSRSVEWEATLSVRSSGREFDRFRVRLPKGAELVPGTPLGYIVTEIRPNGPQKPGPREVEIRLAEKKKGPVEVRLAASRLHEVAKVGQDFDLAGFEVAEAGPQRGHVRQWGHIAVAVADDWQVRWGSSRGVQRVEQWPDSLRHELVVAGFEYFAQPCQLNARLAARKTRINVEPEYLLLVDDDQVQLEAKLKYTVRGAKAFELSVAMPDWQFDEVEPDYLVDVDDVRKSDAGVYTFPLLQASTGQMELRIRARWAVQQESGSLTLPLPQPQADWQRGASVVVLPADNIKLTPKPDEIKGLIRQQVVPQMELPDRQQDPWYYRGEAAGAVFAADYRVQPQSIAVAASGQINLDEQSGSVKQTLSYTIRHEPADHFTIAVPRILARSEELEFVHEGVPLAPTVLGDDDAAEDESAPVRMRVVLDKACIGQCELLVRHSIRLPKLSTGEAAPVRVPLVMPADGELSENSILVNVAPGMKVEVGAGAWKVSQPTATRAAQDRGLQLTAEARSQDVRLSVRLEDADTTGITVVERAWVRTWLTYSARQDRAVFAFTSNRKSLHLAVPEGVAADKVDVLLDGKPVPIKPLDGGLIEIPLPSEPNLRPHVLEVQSFFQRRPRPGRLSLEIPRLEDNAWVRRLYWQLVVPKNEHVLTVPKGFTPEFAWGWGGYSWGRRALLSQAELESWVGAAEETHVPEGINSYLFSAMENVAHCELRTAGRAWIVLVASGAALVAGLLLIYVPVSRHPGALFASGVVLLCAGLLYPEPALLVSQAASLGLALTLLAGLMERSVARRRRGIMLRETSSSILERPSTPTPPLPPLPDGQTSTESAPIQGGADLSPPKPDSTA